MNRTRWKLMIGAFGLGAAGLAAVAGPGNPGCAPATPPSAKAPAELPTPPTVPALPTAPPLVIPASGEVPAVPTLPQLPPVTSVKPEPKPPAADVKPASPPPPSVPFEVNVAAPPTGGVQVLTIAPPAPTPMPPSGSPASGTVPPPSQPSTPVVPPGKALGYNKDGTAVPVTPPVPMFLTSGPAEPEGARIPPTPLADTPRQAAPTLSEPVAAPKPTPVQPVAATAVAEKKLTVMLHMGDERPKFEIKDQNEVYLKVASDRVDVQSPKDGRANQSEMRATGKVVFVTPGGEGTCNELAVVPGTGQVTVTGNVAFTYNWGKVETTVTGEKMTFRLGSTPGATDRPAAMR